MMSAIGLDEVEPKLLAIVREFHGVKEGEPLDVQEAVMSLDSLDKIDLVYRIEDRFDTKIDKLDNIDNFDDIVRELKNKLRV
jgi:acyl carrier protein